MLTVTKMKIRKVYVVGNPNEWRNGYCSSKVPFTHGIHGGTDQADYYDTLEEATEARASFGCHPFSVMVLAWEVKYDPDNG